MKAVLDTNVLISSFITKGTSFRIFRRGLIGEYQILVSRETVHELRNILLENPEKFRLAEEDVERRIAILEYFGDFINIEGKIEVIEKDPSDNIFLELALNGEADYIVSGDSHLLDIGSFRGIDILTPREFLQILKGK